MLLHMSNDRYINDCIHDMDMSDYRIIFYVHVHTFVTD